jgi:hypothetical protein
VLRSAEPESASNSFRHIPRKLVMGDSRLCAPNHCCGYRPAALHAEPIDSGMSNVGFHCDLRQAQAL